MFFTILEQPLINILFSLYSIIPGNDFGVAVVLFTVIIRFALWPLMNKQLHGQKKIQAIQPKVKKINAKYKNNPQKQREALMELYKTEEVNPGSSCLLSLVQLPILFALFYVFKDFASDAYIQLRGTEGIIGDVYPFIQNLSFVRDFISTHEVVNTQFLGLVDLAKPSIFLAVLAGILQFFQSKMLMPAHREKDATTAIMTQMTYFMPVMITVFAISLPAVLPLYWALTTVFAIIQQKLVMTHEVKEFEEGTVIASEKKKGSK